MRLIVLFHGIKTEDDDYASDIILTDYDCKIRAKKIIYTELWNASMCDRDLYKNINEALSILPAHYKLIKNEIAVGLIFPVVRIIYQIEDILAAYEVNEIVLFGGSKTEFVTTLFAEGEGEKRFYSSAWLCNRYIYDYFKKICRVRWKARSGVGLRIFCHIRNQAVVFWSLFYMLARDYRLSAHINKAQYGNGRDLIVCIANLPLQYTHLMKLCSNSCKYEPLYICNRRIKSDANRSAVLVKAGFGYIVALYLRIKRASKCCKQDVIRLRYKNQNLEFRLEDVIKGYFPAVFEAECEKKRITETLRLISLIKRPSYVITDMTVGKDITAVHEAARAAKIEHANFQYVLMTRILYPELHLADKYYLYAKKTYELYKMYDESYQYYVPFRHTGGIKNKKRTLTVFTQADHYAERYIYALKEIMKSLISNELDINLNLKLHYRQNLKEQFESLTERYDEMQIVNGSVEEIIRSSDAVLSMTSSVIFEAVMMHVPAIIIDFNGINRYYIENNDIGYCEINPVIRSPKELVDILNDFEGFLENYNEKYREYFKYAPGGDGIDDYL